LVSGRDGDVLIADGISGADFRAFGVESDCKRTTLSGLFGFTGVIDNALVVLRVDVRTRNLAGCVPRSFHD
jgi:hypothetical protein